MRKAGFGLIIVAMLVVFGSMFANYYGDGYTFWKSYSRYDILNAVFIWLTVGVSAAGLFVRNRAFDATALFGAGVVACTFFGVEYLGNAGPGEFVGDFGVVLAFAGAALLVASQAGPVGVGIGGTPVRYAGIGLVMVALLMGVGSMFLHYYDGPLTYWQLNQYWDVIAFVFVTGFLVVAAVSLAIPNRSFDSATMFAAGFVGSAYSYVETTYESAGPGAYVGDAAAVVAIAGAVLLALSLASSIETGPGRVAAVASGGVAPAAGRGTPAAGWYPDPGGSGQARYWDGAEWTESLR